MGMILSCPFATVDDLDSRLESFLVRSISFGSDDVKAAHQSGSCNDLESEPFGLRSYGSGKRTIEGLLRSEELESELKAPFLEGEMVRLANDNNREVQDKLMSPENLSEKNYQSLLQESGDHKYQAAVKLQKTYKSFRTRRQLADCAVLVEQRWWKLLDFAELKRSSVSFFDIEKPETAVSRWSRARTRAAKVGKGLSKDEKARKLALQHWLEAIDPRHRYGHNLQFYYVKWLQCESKQPFFYWLDIGEGKEVNLEKCPRSKLQQQCIKYLGPMEREEFEVIIDNGRLIYKQSGKLLDTRGGPEDAKWIFVLSVSKILYVGQKKKGIFQHSSFLAGGATLSAGRLVVEDGILKAVWPHSGHYLPTEENFEEFMTFLEQHDVDLSMVKKAPTGDDEASFVRRESTVLRNSLSVPNFSESIEETNTGSLDTEKTDSHRNKVKITEDFHPPSSRWSTRLHAKLALIQIPKRENMSELFKDAGPSCSSRSVETPVDGYETAEEYLSDTEFSVSKENLFDEDQDEDYEERVPKEKIIKRINSHKGMKSYQLAKQLSCKWTTGAGPRIGCVRDYPSELQSLVLEEVNLSPRSPFSSPRKSAQLSPTVSSATNLCRETTLGRSPLSSIVSNVDT